MNAKELTDSQKDIFIVEFYNLWDNELDYPNDTGSPTPWGCPWLFGGPIELKGKDVKEMAENFWQDHKEEITALCLGE